MTDLQKFQVVCRVFPARLLMVHSEDAPEVLRRMADELEWLEAEEAGESAGGDLGQPTQSGRVGTGGRALRMDL